MRAVNLLPADRRKGGKTERSAPKLSKLHGIGLGVLVGALALGYYGHGISGKAAAQKAQADANEATAQTLQTQIATAKQKQQGTPQASSFETDKVLVTGLAQARVNWADVIINLSRVAPAGVWVERVSVSTPTTAAAGSTGAAGTTPERPAAITLTSHAMTRTSAALFISRLDAIPGFDQPRLQGGINPKAASDGTTGSTGYDFTVEIPLDDGIFGSEKPGAKSAASGTAPAGGTAPTTPTSTGTN